MANIKSTFEKLTSTAAAVTALGLSTFLTGCGNDADKERVLIHAGEANGQDYMLEVNLDGKPYNNKYKMLTVSESDELLASANVLTPEQLQNRLTDLKQENMETVRDFIARHRQYSDLMPYDDFFKKDVTELSADECSKHLADITQSIGYQNYHNDDDNKPVYDEEGLQEVRQLADTMLEIEKALGESRTIIRQYERDNNVFFEAPDFDFRTTTESAPATPSRP